MKKIVSLALSAIMATGLVAGLSACGEKTYKIGMICLHGSDSTYDKNFIDAMKQACENKGLSEDLTIVTNIPEDSSCYDTAMEMVDQGCDLIFADSFGHESFLLQAAKENPDVQFCHATGTMAHTENVSNFHNAFASIYEGRYLAGVAAGMKLNEMIEAETITADQAKMGYVGAFTFAEVISGYTSFYLGARSVCPTVTMDVKFTGSWYDEILERSAAESLIAGGCKLISQHADSMGAPSACEAAGVPNVSYNGSTASAAPNTYIISSRINWVPYFEYIIDCAINGQGTIATDWAGGLGSGSAYNDVSGSVVLTDIGTAAAAGTVEKLEEVRNALKAGTIKVFDTSKFTVGGQPIAADYKADVDTDADYTPDTVVVSNGIFEESKYRSAPYFALEIDGITLLDRNYGD